MTLPAVLTNAVERTTSLGWLAGIIFISVLLVQAMLLWSPSMRRPLEQDEAVTVKAYATFGYSDTMAQQGKRDRFDVWQTARGLVKCFWNHWDPNNHVMHSLLVSLSTFFLGFSEWSARIPAFVAALAATLVLMLWVHSRTRSRLCTLVLGLLFAVNPYVVHYGQTARGYSITLFLVLLQMMILEQSRTPSARFWLAGLWHGMLAVGIGLNLLSSVFVWLTPMYLCLWLCGPDFFPALARETPRRWLWRPYLLCSSLVVAGGVGAFVVLNLKAMQRAQGRYGVKLNNVHDGVHAVGDVIREILPGGYALIGVLGVVGLVLMLKRPRQHWLGPTCVVSGATTLAYVALTRTVPYPRTFGLWLIPIIAGVAHLWTLLAATKVLRQVRAVLIISMLCVIAATSVNATTTRGHWPASFNDIAVSITRAIEQCGDDPHDTFIALPCVFGEEMRFYLPDSPVYCEAKSEQEHLVLYLPVTRVRGEYCFRTEYFDRAKEEFVFWPVPRSKAAPDLLDADSGFYRLPTRRIAVPEDSSDWLMTAWIPSRDPGLRDFVAEQMRQNVAPWNVNFFWATAAGRRALMMLSTGNDAHARVRAMLAQLQARSAGTLAFYRSAPTPVSK